MIQNLFLTWKYMEGDYLGNFEISCMPLPGRNSWGKGQEFFIFKAMQHLLKKYVLSRIKSAKKQYLVLRI